MHACPPEMSHIDMSGMSWVPLGVLPRCYLDHCWSNVTVINRRNGITCYMLLLKTFEILFASLSIITRYWVVILYLLCWLWYQFDAFVTINFINLFSMVLSFLDRYYLGCIVLRPLSMHTIPNILQYTVENWRKCVTCMSRTALVV